MKITIDIKNHVSVLFFPDTRIKQISDFLEKVNEEIMTSEEPLEGIKISDLLNDQNI